MPKALVILVSIACVSISGCGGGGTGPSGNSSLGINNLPPVTAPGTPVPLPTATPIPVPGNGTSLAGPSLDPHGAWGPPAIATALQFPVQSGFDGTRQSVAILMDAYPDAGDYQAYLAYFQIPVTARTIVRRDVSGGPSGMDSNSEVTLDTETVAGLAPGANIIVYGLPDNTLASLNDGLNQILSERVANIVSYSAGACEKTFSDSGLLSGTHTLLQQLAQAGIAVVAASGDSGNDCAAGPNYVVGVSYPAADPNVTGVGGTQTDSSAGHSLTSTAAWSDVCGAGPCVAGGGVSAYFALPSYQSGLVGASSRTNRNVPDVSMPAEVASEYVNGSWSWGVVGTSWSAPQYAALLAEVYEYCNVVSMPAVTIPYAVFAANTTAFIDVTSGNNEVQGAPFYSAGAGYDNASGLGVPLGMAFANTLCPNRAAASAVRSSPELPYAMQGAARGFTADVTPRVLGLTDRGPRGANERTDIQIVLRPSSTLAADEHAVVSALHSAGFTVTRTFANHFVVDARAASGAVERLFATQMRDVVQGRYGVRYIPATPVNVPASLAPYVAGISLDNVVTMHAPR